MVNLDVIGRKYGPIRFEHTWRDVILYALSIGAGPDELPFIYERAEGGLQVYPTFGVIMGYDLFAEIARDLRADFSRFIHGEERIKLYDPIPPEGRTVIEGSVTNIYDKGKGALIVWLKKVMTENGDPLCEIESGIYYVGEGGFGGEPGPKSEAVDPPEGIEPDFAVSHHIPENQAALYRLNGDLNPLHLDPTFAKKGGFDRPILHGLCTFGYATRAILSAACDNDVHLFKEFRARFSGVVYPGDNLTTEGWRDKEGAYVIRSRTDRGIVLNRAYTNVE
jgi:acyl dehydratase